MAKYKVGQVVAGKRLTSEDVARASQQAAPSVSKTPSISTSGGGGGVTTLPAPKAASAGDVVAGRRITESEAQALNVSRGVTKPVPIIASSMPAPIKDKLGQGVSMQGVSQQTAPSDPLAAFKTNPFNQNKPYTEQQKKNIVFGMPAQKEKPKGLTTGDIFTSKARPRNAAEKIAEVQRQQLLGNVNLEIVKKNPEIAGLTSSEKEAVKLGLYGGAAVGTFGTGGLGGLGLNLARGYIGANVGVGGFKLGEEIASPKEEKEFISKNYDLMRGGVQNVAKEKREKLKGNIVGSIVESLPIAPLFTQDRAKVEQSLTKYYQDQGLRGKELDIAVKATREQRAAGLIGEGGVVFGGNVFSEIVGQGFVSTAFKTAGKVAAKQAPAKLFGLAGWNIGKAGIIEGVTVEAAGQAGRFEDPNIKNLAIGGGAGFLTAGLIGGTIAATKINRPAVSKVVEIGAYITDPFEKPADIAAEKLIRGAKIPVATPVIFDSRSFESIGFGAKEKAPTKESPALIMGAVSKKKTLSGADIFTSDNLPKKPPTDTQLMKRNLAAIKTNLADLTINVPTKRGGGGGVPTITPFPDITGSVPAPINPFPNVPNIINPTNPIKNPLVPNIPTEIPINIPTTTNIPIFTTIPTPVSSMYVPPPVPLAFPTDFGGAGFGVGKRKKYVNELAAAQALIFGGKAGLRKAESSAKKEFKKSAKKYKGGKAKKFDPFGFVFG